MKLDSIQTIMAKKKKKKRLWSELKSQEKKFFCILISHFAYVYNIYDKESYTEVLPPPQAVPHWGWQHHSVLQYTWNGGNGGDHLLTLHPSAVPQTFLSFYSSRIFAFPFLWFFEIDIENIQAIESAPVFVYSNYVKP